MTTTDPRDYPRVNTEAHTRVADEPRDLDAPSAETESFELSTGDAEDMLRVSGEALSPGSRPEDRGGGSAAGVRRDPTRVPTSPVQSLARGTLVDNYRVDRLVGRGGMGEVYLARDTLLGRRVALKVIHRKRIGSAEAIARFLFEARTTARFSHPHIVAIHGVGEHEGQPYLALEYLEGRSLRARLREGRPSTREATRIAVAIAEGLAEAHRNGVLHRDLKPDNVFLPSDGRLRVVDFGLARVRRQDDAGTERWQGASAEYAPERPVPERAAIYGTPSYMAPELWRGLGATEAADVWALALILHEMLTGIHPYRGPERASPLAIDVCSPRPVPVAAELELAPEAIRQIVLDCLSKDPRHRPGAAAVARALRDWLDPPRHRAGGEIGPFPGLAAFDEQHAHLYFGRHGEIVAFVERVRTEPIVPVIGPSGAGKTSFVQAGVLPRLREQGKWRVLRMRPGARPFLTLARRLIAADVDEGETDETVVEEDSEDAATSHDRTAEYAGMTSSLLAGTGDGLGPIRPLDETLGDDPNALASRLQMFPTSLNLALQRIAERAGAPVLLFVDQLEEIHTQVEDEEVRRAFLQAVCTAADDPDAPVRVVLTLRDDFLGRLAYGAEVRVVLGRVTVIRRMDEEALLEALVQPLHLVDYRFEDSSLARKMVREVIAEPAALSLLQFAARTLWERRDTTRRLLRREAFESLGGVAGALAEHADGVLEGLSASELRAAREILLRLVSPERTRRAITTEAALRGLGPDGERALERLTSSRLISVRKGQEDDQPQLELVHDSLIRTWLRLAAWIDESREDRAVLDEVVQAAELWHRRGRRDDEVWTGDALQDARRALDQTAHPPSGFVPAFMSASENRQAPAEPRRRLPTIAALAVLALITLASLVTAIALADRSRISRARLADAEQAWAGVLLEGAREASARGEVREARARLRTALEVAQVPGGGEVWREISAEAADHDPGAERCELLQRVWEEVPEVWEGGGIVVRRPPDDHECSRDGY